MRHLLSFRAIALLLLQATFCSVLAEHEYRDLGLPSGTLWATCNIGANSEEDYGDTFAWGVTSPSHDTFWDTYFDTQDGGETFMKYNFEGGKTELDPEDDAAYVNWGPQWRMPTNDQFDELLDYCSWSLSTLHGVEGFRFEGPNGNSIFFPMDEGYGYYWPRTLGYDDGTFVLYLYNRPYFDPPANVTIHGFMRVCDFCVRPVYTPSSAPDTDASLIAHWPFDGDAKDASGNGHDGTVNGNVALTTDRFGNPNSAYQFPGSAWNYISVPHSPDLLLDEFTISAWIYSDDENRKYGQGEYIVCKGRDITNGAYRLKVRSVGATNQYGAINDAGVSAYPSCGSWHFVAGTVKGQDARYYLDGVLQDSRTLTNPFHSNQTDDLTIGMHFYNGVPSSWAYPYYGKIDDVRIYNRVLSETEIAMLYDGQHQAVDTRIYFTESSQTMVIGSTFTPEIHISPSSLKREDLIWGTSNNEVATVNTEGVVTAVGEGACRIDARTKGNNSQYASFVLSVVRAEGIDAIQTLTIVNVSGIPFVEVGQALKFEAKAMPETTKLPEIVWEVHNSQASSFNQAGRQVATIDQNGTMTAVGEGNAIVTARVKNNDLLSASYPVFVKPTTKDEQDNANIRIYRSYRDLHDFDLAKGVTADGKSELLFQPRDMEGAVKDKMPILKGYDIDFNPIDIPEDGLGTIVGIHSIGPNEGDYDWDGYIYRAPENIYSAALGKNHFYHVKVFYPVKSGTAVQYEELCTIKVCRPVLILVHGLLSSPTECFSHLQSYLTERSFWPFAFVDYEATHASSFETNAFIERVVGKRIEEVFSHLYKNYGIVSTAYDLAGHSMGGILSRFFGQEGRNADYVHKLITMNTPHWGSKLADFANTVDFMTFRLLLDWLDKEAVGNLACNGTAILDLSLNTEKLKNVPVHAMCSYINPNDNEEIIEAGNKICGAKNKLNALWEDIKFLGKRWNNVVSDSQWETISMIYGEPQWDFWVGYTSQKAGLESPYISVFSDDSSWYSVSSSRAHHCNVLEWDAYCDRLLDLVCARTDCGNFSSAGFQPIDNDYRYPEWSNYSAPKQARMIIDNDENTYVKPIASWSYNNDSIYINVNIEKSNNISATMVKVPLENNMALSESDRDEYHFVLPSSYSGHYKLYVLGRTQDEEFVCDSTVLVLPQIGTMQSLYFTKDSPYLVAGQENGFEVIGQWKDGSSRPVPAQLSSSNESIATINGRVVEALSPGVFTLTADYNGQTATLDIEVLEGSQPEAIQKVTADIESSVLYYADAIHIKSTGKHSFSILVYNGAGAIETKLDVSVDRSEVSIPCHLNTPGVHIICCIREDGVLRTERVISQ